MRAPSRIWLTFGVLVVMPLTACGTSSPAAAQAPSDAGTGADVDDAATPTEDAAVDAPFAPGSHPATPTVTNSGGSVLAAQLDAFAQAVGASAYWESATHEYGVGPLGFARSVHVAAAPSASIDSTALESWLISQLDGTHAEWGTPDASTIYTIVYPVGMTITMSGQSICSSSPAYHSEVTLGSGTTVPYAAMAQCGSFQGLSGIDYVTGGLSHEWVEASTDPFPNSSPAYYGPPPRYNDWAIVTGGELADMCTILPDVYFQPTGLPFTVQRTWSNAAASAGHDPCVPAPVAPYFNAAPVMPDTLHGSYFGQSITSEGLEIAIGQSKAVEVDLFSDAKTQGPWAVRAVAFGAEKLTFAWSAMQGSNGDKLELTVTRVKDDPDVTGVDLFAIVSTLGTDEHAWVGAIGD
jgi:hypothetical protein